MAQDENVLYEASSTIAKAVQNALKKHREEVSREKFAKKIGVESQTLFRYERAKVMRLDFETVSKILIGLPRELKIELLHATNILTNAECDVLLQSTTSGIYDLPIYDASSRHIERLKRFYEEMTYTLFYYDSQHDKNELTTMALCLTKTVASGFISGSATVRNNYSYSCKLISPPGEFYTYIYLTSNSISFEDHAVIIIPFNRLMIDKFQGGIGMMLSLSLERDQLSPCFQKVVILSDTVGKPDETLLKSIHDQYLLLSTESVHENRHDSRKVYGDQLTEENIDFENHVLKRIEKKLDKSV